MNPTQSSNELNLTGTGSPTSAPTTDSPVAPVMNTLSPTDSPTISPVDVEAMEPESVNTDAVSGSSKLSFGLKELTIPIICLFFIK